MPADQVIGIIATVRVKPEHVEEYHRALMTLIEDHSTREPDCIDIVVHHDVDDRTRVMLYERWRVARDRFIPEQMSKPFIKAFTERTRHMLATADDVSYWSATDLVAGGVTTRLAGKAAIPTA